jgi:hypothetical protein
MIVLEVNFLSPGYACENFNRVLNNTPIKKETITKLEKSRTEQL